LAEQWVVKSAVRMVEMRADLWGERKAERMVLMTVEPLVDD
jgi:hypothetical protein